MSTTIDNFTIEQAVEDRARELGHDLRLATFDQDGNPVWHCINQCGIIKVRLVHHVNGWTLENRPIGRCDETD